MKEDMKMFGVTDDKVKWEESQRAPLRVTPLTRHNTGPSSLITEENEFIHTYIQYSYIIIKNVYSIVFKLHCKLYTWRLRDTLY